jgi:hypothetical protein
MSELIKIEINAEKPRLKAISCYRHSKSAFAFGVPKRDRIEHASKCAVIPAEA